MHYSTNGMAFFRIFLSLSLLTAVALLPAGSWFFDAERREFGYLPRLDFL